MGSFTLQFATDRSSEELGLNSDNTEVNLKTYSPQIMMRPEFRPDLSNLEASD
jgi:hypothetical protein